MPHCDWLYVSTSACHWLPTHEAWPVARLQRLSFRPFVFFCNLHAYIVLLCMLNSVLFVGCHPFSLLETTVYYGQSEMFMFMIQ